MKTTKQFKVYKEGVTDTPQTIVSIKGVVFNFTEKVNKYKSLGYTVTDLNGKQL